MVTRPHAKDETRSDRHPVEGKALFEVDTPDGRRPYIPASPEPAPRPLDNEGNELPDNPANPRGKPSLSLPQQATPLTSQQGVAAVEDITDPVKAHATMTVQDGQAPDDPFNPKGTPDYIVAPEELQGPDAVTNRETRRQSGERPETHHGNQDRNQAPR